MLNDADINEIKRRSGKTPMEKALAAHGITADTLAQKLKAELYAKTTKHFAHEGRVITTKQHVDWGTRQKARMDAQKLLGQYPADQIEGNGRGAMIVLNYHRSRPKDGEE